MLRRGRMARRPDLAEFDKPLSKEQLAKLVRRLKSGRHSRDGRCLENHMAVETVEAAELGLIGNASSDSVIVGTGFMRPKRLRIDQLKPGPIRHPDLSPLMIARIASLHSTLDEVYPQSLETWLDGFQRDTHPEREVAWWERVARCYVEYSRRLELNPQQRQAAFKVIFGLNIGSRENEIATDLAHLPQGALAEIVAIMRSF